MFVAVTITTHAFTDFIGEAIRTLVPGIPGKIKFVMGSRIPISVPEPSESLVVMALGKYKIFERLLVILNKRWQTLDLISMMEELKRSVNEELNRPEYRQKWFNPAFQEDFQMVSVLADSLSSRPRFKKEEDLTDSG